MPIPNRKFNIYNLTTATTMRDKLTENEAIRLANRLKAAGYEEKYGMLEKKFDGYTISFAVFDMFGWHATMRVDSNNSTLAFWVETLKSRRVRDMELMARKFLEQIGSYQKEA